MILQNHHGIFLIFVLHVVISLRCNRAHSAAKMKAFVPQEMFFKHFYSGILQVIRKFNFTFPLPNEPWS